MKAMVIEAGALALRDVPTPLPGKGEVRVRVVATAVNRADLLQVKGLYPAPPGSPKDIPGLEYAGVVDALGDEVSEWRIGDPVVGLAGGGTYAEYVVAHARTVSPAPKSLPLLDAAALPEALLTAWDAIVSQGAIRAGETLLVHAAASGVGTAAVQIGRALFAHVIATCRTPSKVQRIEALGARHVIVVESSRFSKEVVALSSRGADVTLDLVGGAYTAESVRATAPGGRIMLVGLTAGRTAELDLGEILRRRITLRGTVMRSRPLEEKIALANVFTTSLLPMIEARAVVPVLDETFSLEDAARAHERVQGNQTVGKVLLRVGDP